MQTTNAVSSSKQHGLPRSNPSPRSPVALAALLGLLPRLLPDSLVIHLSRRLASLALRLGLDADDGARGPLGYLRLGLLPRRRVALNLVFVERQRVDELALLLAQRLQDLVAALLELVVERRLKGLEPLVDDLVVVHARRVLAADTEGLALRQLGLDGLGDEGREVRRHLAEDLDEHGEELLRGQRELRRDDVEILALLADGQQNGLLHAREPNVGLEAAGEVEVGDGGDEVEDDVVVEHVVRIRLETLQVERRHEPVKVRLVEGRGLLLVELGAEVRRLVNAQRHDGRERAELVRQQREETLVEVAREGTDPRPVAAILERSQHDAGVLASQVVGRLSQVHGREGRPLPELVQLLGEAVADANVVEQLGLLFGELGEQGRHLVDVANLNVVLEEVRVLELLVRDASDGVLHDNVLLVQARELALVEVCEELQRLGTVAHAHVLGVRGNAHNAGSGQRGKVLILELLADQPGDEITRRPLAPAQRVEDALPADLTLERHLDDTQGLRKALVFLRNGRHEDVELVRRGVAHQLQIVGRVLVVAGDVQRDHLLQELFGNGVEGEEGIAVDLEELALRRVRAALAADLGPGQGRVQAEEGVEPLLDGVALGVTNRLRECDLAQRAASLETRRLLLGSAARGTVSDGGVAVGRRAWPRLLTTLVTVDGGGHKDEVGTHELADEGQRNGGGLIDDDQLGLAKNVSVLRPDVLDGLAVLPVDVDANNRLVEVGVRGLNDRVVGVVGVAQGVKTLEDELEERLQVLWRGRRDENVAVSVGHGGSDGHTHGSRLATTSRRRQGDCAAQRLLGNGVDECQEGLGLVDSLGEGNQGADWLGILKRLLHAVQLLLGFAHRLIQVGRRQGRNVFAARDGQNVHLVVNDKTRVAAAERQDEALVKAGNDVVVGLGTVPVVDVHGQVVELLQAVHTLEQQDDEAATLNRLHGLGENVGRQCLEVLEDTHAKGVSENLLSLLVVDVADVVQGDEGFEGVHVVGLTDAALHLFLDLVLSLLSVTALRPVSTWSPMGLGCSGTGVPREVEELALVGPENRFVLLELHLRHDVVQVHDDVLAAVADHDEEASLLLLQAIADERGDARVSIECVRAILTEEKGNHLDLHLLLLLRHLGGVQSCWVVTASG
ncbi:hypothetical protein BN1708_007250 [Verticillium longisporum]|uniref:Uncharacterized protein n=1 Tax=Verticillium longisporum TaxID=100787 RepID=A0A0G4MRV6_VERLO|nr:hypothetical protein BN1708_007250 [Verticillium longisporum]